MSLCLGALYLVYIRARGREIQYYEERNRLYATQLIRPQLTIKQSF
jgi:hypothetical protein